MKKFIHLFHSKNRQNFAVDLIIERLSYGHEYHDVVITSSLTNEQIFDILSKIEENPLLKMKKMIMWMKPNH